MTQSKQGMTPSGGGQRPPLSAGAELQALAVRSVRAPSSARLSPKREKDRGPQTGATCFGRDQDYPKHTLSAEAT